MRSFRAKIPAADRQKSSWGKCQKKLFFPYTPPSPYLSWFLFSNYRSIKKKEKTAVIIQFFALQLPARLLLSTPQNPE